MAIIQTTSKLESQTCGRCHGTGQYSFNYMDGSRCYGCNGKGWRLTKRGAVITQELRASRTIAYSDMMPGMIIDHTVKVFDGRNSGRITVFVESINSDESGATDFRGRSINGSVFETRYHGAFKDTFRVRGSVIELRDLFVSRAMTLLTKSGKIRKGKDSAWSELIKMLHEGSKPAIYNSFDEWKASINRSRPKTS